MTATEPGGLVQGAADADLKTLTLNRSMATASASASNRCDGGFRVNGGSLFPGLRRLERDGLIRESGV